MNGETAMKPCHIHIRFHPDFQVFLKRRGSCDIDYTLTRKAPLCDIVEALGVPHPEIGGIRNGAHRLRLEFIPSRDMALTVDPVPPPFDVCRPSFLRPDPMPCLRFIVDENVAKLASLMRILGLDTAYVPGIDDRELAQIAHSENRVVLSKDIQLFKRRIIVFGRFIRAVNPIDQLREVLDFFAIRKPLDPFSRCLNCNTPLVPVSKESILHRLEPKTKLYFNDFKICRTCDKIIWKGSHHDHMVSSLKSAGISIPPVE